MDSFSFWWENITIQVLQPPENFYLFQHTLCFTVWAPFLWFLQNCVQQRHNWPFAEGFSKASKLTNQPFPSLYFFVRARCCTSSFQAPVKFFPVLKQEEKKGSSTNLLQDYFPWVEPLEVDKGKNEVEEGRGDHKDGQLPAELSQKVEGLILLGKRPNVVAKNQMLFPYIGRWNWRIRFC